MAYYLHTMQYTHYVHTVLGLCNNRNSSIMIMLLIIKIIMMAS